MELHLQQLIKNTYNNIRRDYELAMGIKIQNCNFRQAFSSTLMKSTLDPASYLWLILPHFYSDFNLFQKTHNEYNNLRILIVKVLLSLPIGLVTVHVYVPLSLTLTLLMV